MLNVRRQLPLTFYNVDGDEKELETIEMFRASARHVGVRQ